MPKQDPIAALALERAHASGSPRIKRLTEEALRRADRLARDDQSLEEGLDAEHAELTREYGLAIHDANVNMSANADERERELLRLAVPKPGSPDAHRLARDEVQLRLGHVHKARLGEEALELARTGSREIRAALASSWGRAYLDSLGSAAMHTHIVGTVVEAAAEEGDPAARAFLDDDNRAKVAAGREAEHFALQYLRRGRKAAAEPHRRESVAGRRDDRHADLRDLGKVEAGDGA